jgi:site-specific recombinase XerD
MGYGRRKFATCGVKTLILSMAASGSSASRAVCQRNSKQRGDSQLPWLFLTERGDQLTRFALNYLVRVAGERAGLGFSVHPHMLRHGCGYALANRGYDLRLIQDYLGHRSPYHTMRYTRTAASRFEGLW